MPPAELVLSRQLQAFGDLPLVAGGFADQPQGYLRDVQLVRSYERAKELCDAATSEKPSPRWASALVSPVQDAYVEWLMSDE
jgi:hypothetical protein